MAKIPISVYYYQIKTIKNEVNKYKYIELKNQGRKIGKNKVLKIMRKKDM